MTETIRAGLEWVTQQLIEAEATAFIGGAATNAPRPRHAAQRPSALLATGDGGAAAPCFRIDARHSRTSTTITIVRNPMT
jgi:hypothetical protein